MSTQPSEEGMRRYQMHGIVEDGVYISDSGEVLPCTCTPKCPKECWGECGCQACERCTMDLAHGQDYPLS